MKYIKTYEEQWTPIRHPKVGDYVICFLQERIKRLNFVTVTQEHRDFIRTHIGKIVDVDMNSDNTYCVKYNDPPEFMKKMLGYPNFETRLWFNKNEMIMYSNIKEQLEEEIKEYKFKEETNKYNI